VPSTSAPTSAPALGSTHASTGPSHATSPQAVTARSNEASAANATPGDDSPLAGLRVRTTANTARQSSREDAASQGTPTQATPLASGVPATAGSGPAYGSPPKVGAAGVTGQVFPEVARLVTRGDGTHRLTLKLTPEALGDVRVVLTVRNGEVHVRLSGSDAAQNALLSGAGELHRLLDRSGAAATHVVVGDRTAADPGLAQSTQDGRSDLMGSREGSSDGAGRQSDNRTAGTRDGATSARDGAPGGTRPRSSTDPAAGTGGGTRTRSTGVDVTM
jgi:flagellar hook-length control protein FliK